MTHHHQHCHHNQHNRQINFSKVSSCFDLLYKKNIQLTVSNCYDPPPSTPPLQQASEEERSARGEKSDAYTDMGRAAPADWSGWENTAQPCAYAHTHTHTHVYINAHTHVHTSVSSEDKSDAGRNKEKK